VPEKTVDRFMAPTTTARVAVVQTRYAASAKAS
jgi:hypothetical protein